MKLESSSNSELKTFNVAKRWLMKKNAHKNIGCLISKRMSNVLRCARLTQRDRLETQRDPAGPTADQQTRHREALEQGAPQRAREAAELPDVAARHQHHQGRAEQAREALLRDEHPHGAAQRGLRAAVPLEEHAERHQALHRSFGPLPQSRAVLHAELPLHRDESLPDLQPEAQHHERTGRPQALRQSEARTRQILAQRDPGAGARVHGLHARR